MARGSDRELYPGAARAPSGFAISWDNNNLGGWIIQPAGLWILPPDVTFGRNHPSPGHHDIRLDRSSSPGSGTRLDRVGRQGALDRGR